MDRADPHLNMQLWDEAVNFGGYGIIPIKFMMPVVNSNKEVLGAHQEKNKKRKKKIYIPKLSQPCKMK